LSGKRLQSSDRHNRPCNDKYYRFDACICVEDMLVISAKKIHMVTSYEGK